VRKYFLYTDGWEKDTDHNVVTGDTVAPLPLHGQDDQRYGFEASPLGAPDWIYEYNTRFVPAEWPEGSGN
jgi:hypothetical protein